MKNNKNLKYLPISTISILTIILLIALPLPFTPLSHWLEKLVNLSFDSCDCLCPWWLFTFWQILVSTIIYKYEKTIKSEKRRNYIIKTIVVALLTFLLHFFLHRYYINKEIFSQSVYCSWFWLIVLIIAIIFSIFNPKEKKS